ncbi:hypothetical protein CDD83_8329 [Cordyceps sp. RAO-2017]|nr:hypothetical protein CDD83_8329 [Cordyceps sp. RAO-2017]
MGNSASTQATFNRLDLAILLENVSPAWCQAQLSTNGYARNITVSGNLGGLVCAGSTVPPAWVLDGEGSRLATFSHLRVPDSASYVVEYRHPETGEDLWEFVDDIQPGAHSYRAPDHVEGCGERGMCSGSMTVKGIEYGVSFTGKLAALLCGDFPLAPPPLGGPDPYGAGALSGLRNVDLSINSTVGIHQPNDGLEFTLVVGTDRTIIWPGYLGGSNWEEYDRRSGDPEAGPAWAHACSSRCASCRTRCTGDCYAELMSDLRLDAILAPPPSKHRAENQRAARHSWMEMRSDGVPPHLKIGPRIQHEALPKPVSLSVARDGPYEYLGKDASAAAREKLQERTEPVIDICERLTDPANPDGSGAKERAGPGASAAESLLGIRDGQVVDGGAAARILDLGGTKNVSDVVFGGAGAGSTADSALDTACNVALGTVEFGYDPDSEAGRAIEAWRKTLTGEGLSTKEWSRLWQDYPAKFPVIRQILGLATGETTIGINENHPLIKAIKYYVSTPVPCKAPSGQD